MRRRALLAAVGGGTAALAGCPTPPWTDDPVAFTAALVPERVVIRHEDETVLDESG